MQELRHCHACRWRFQGWVPLYGIGIKSKCKIMIINDYANLDKHEIHLSKKITEKLGVRRVSCFTNLLKCCGNIDKNKKYIEGAICKLLWLDKEIEDLRPDIIILFGERIEEYFFDIVKDKSAEIFCGSRELKDEKYGKNILVFNFKSMEDFLHIPDIDLKPLHIAIMATKRKKGI